MNVLMSFFMHRVYCPSAYRIVAGCLILLSPGHCIAQTPRHNWDDLKQLQPGIQLVVVTGHRLSCTLIQVTDNEMICQQPFRGLTRNRILEVRLGGGKRGAVIGVLSGVAAGGALATASSKGNEGMKVTAGAGLGVAVGAVLGFLAGILMAR